MLRVSWASCALANRVNNFVFRASCIVFRAASYHFIGQKISFVWLNVFYGIIWKFVSRTEVRKSPVAGSAIYVRFVYNMSNRLLTFVCTPILQYAASLLSTVKIQRILEVHHKVKTTRQSVRLFLKRYKQMNSIADVKRRRNSLVTYFHRHLIDLWLSQNCELTSKIIRD